MVHGIVRVIFNGIIGVGLGMFVVGVSPSASGATAVLCVVISAVAFVCLSDHPTFVGAVVGSLVCFIMGTIVGLVLIAVLGLVPGTLDESGVMTYELDTALLPAFIAGGGLTSLAWFLLNRSR